MKHILVIDEDRELCVMIKRAIQGENIKVDCSYSGRSGLERLQTKAYQLVILDMMMSGLDGFETLEKIREESSLPILILTAHGDNFSKVRGLRAGADECLSKPFEREELTARIHSLLRRYTWNRTGEEEMKYLCFEGMAIDLEARSVTTEKGTFSLSPKEFGLLLFCAGNQGKLVTKKSICEEAWGEPYDCDDCNITAVVSRLRKKIEKNSSSPRYIQTVKGIGYRFNSEV
ncbi:MAG: response regulator transcription factor [bacterium]|nr:response regulator transcription factor [bacterium]MCM1375050.1 response regulator transcription factor [Muribaculum sp.]